MKAGCLRWELSTFYSIFFTSGACLFIPSTPPLPGALHLVPQDGHSDPAASKRSPSSVATSAPSVAVRGAGWERGSANRPRGLQAPEPRLASAPGPAAASPPGFRGGAAERLPPPLQLPTAASCPGRPQEPSAPGAPTGAGPSSLLPCPGPQGAFASANIRLPARPMERRRSGEADV